MPDHDQQARELAREVINDAEQAFAGNPHARALRSHMLDHIAAALRAAHQQGRDEGLEEVIGLAKGMGAFMPIEPAPFIEAVEKLKGGGGIPPKPE